MRIFQRKPRKRGNDLIPKGIASTVIPEVFIDGNTIPIWDNNHHLLRNSKKSILRIDGKETIITLKSKE